MLFKLTELITSIQNLSKRKHGALIVVQRNDPLDALIKAGVPVHAEFSQLLLESIFYPGSPLHDGAVLLHRDEIVSAANILLISSKPLDDPSLGTRHRAAIGLTEHCDALVIVVSEETGRASFAFEGRLYAFQANLLY